VVPRARARSDRARRRRASLNGPAPLFSVVVPTLGKESNLLPLIDALAHQTVASALREWIVAFDGAEPSPLIRARLAEAGARAVLLPERRGPGGARNAGAREAKGAWLAFTEDDCTPAADWLEKAAARVGHEPGLDVIEGDTLLPDGGLARRRREGVPVWLPTNLFVRRDLFDRFGGYSEDFFDPRRGIYFREDSDLGFTLAEAGARVALDPSIRVVHPREHSSWLDPIRWARRYEMDPLLKARHPEAFRSQVEVLRCGPLSIRRPFVRACAAYMVAIVAAAGAAVLGKAGVAAWLLALAATFAILIWGKWRWDPRKLPAAFLAPPVLLASLWRGRARARAYLVASRTTR
jgi:glycosyltransferase involved in cell wall biosynthesis